MNKLYILILFTCLSLVAQAQTLQNLQDIHLPEAHPFEYLSTHFYSIKNEVVFYGLTQEEGYGFWHFDGNRAQQISHYGSTERPPAETSDGFYFISGYDVAKYSLYKYGGNPGVTLLIDDIKSSSQNVVPTLTSLNGKAFYPDWDAATGYELWCAGDSTGSARLVADGNPGTGSLFPSELTSADSLIYYRGGGTQGRQLWRSDGTAAGTFKLLHITTTNENIQENSLRTIGNKAYFLIRKTSGATELWVSDGTIPGTLKLTDVTSNYAFPDRFEAFFLNGKYVYLAVNPQNGEPGWAASDGTPAGSEWLLNLPADTHFFLSFYNSQSVKSILNGSFFFFCRNDATLEFELWKSNGTASGTFKVKSLGKAGSPQTLASSNHLFFFLAQNKITNDVELWSSDGTATGTKLTKSLGVMEDYLYYGRGEATDSVILFRSPFFGPDVVDFPYRSDGTEQGTYPVEGLAAPYQAGSGSVGFVQGPDEKVYFRAHDSQQWGIWATAPASGFDVAELDTTSIYHNYLEIGTPMPAGDKMLWFSNDTRLNVLEPGSSILQIDLPLKYAGFWSTGPGNQIYFLCDGGASLWRSDGSLAGTYELLPAPPNSVFYNLKTVGDSLYFLQRILAAGQAQYLWSSDGTAAGTNAIETLSSSATLFLREVDGKIAFSTYDINPYSRTLHVRDYPNTYFEGYFDDDFAGIAIADNSLFVLGAKTYNAVDSIHYPFWVIENGTPTLLQKFKALTGSDPFQVWQRKNQLQSLPGKTIFGAGLRTDNVELWISDGTINGTYELRAIHPKGSSNPDNFIRYNEQLWLFTANDGADVSWWATDGTWEGTFKVAPLASVKDYFVPTVENAYLTGNQLYFSMNDGIIGQEPWVMVMEDSLMVGTVAPLKLENSLHIWPNPAGKVLNLTLDNQSGKWIDLEISNNAGQMVYRQNQLFVPDSGPLSIRLPQQTPGVYYLHVTTKNGKIRTKKFLIAE